MKSAYVIPYPEGPNTPDDGVKPRSILRKSTCEPKSFRVVTRASTIDKKVSFKDPVHELYVVEPIIYKMPRKEASCTCTMF
ncbi:unnamed protein product [Blepharisma stoltei]|uniref:Uncharacterized protein n=1 Tax=Blepharisma stoltei TaxID=1481888 RepID=A0AAU9JFI2_9CILI|nr:unnamed protein product [Blepharisma stoltei]